MPNKTFPSNRSKFIVYRGVSVVPGSSIFNGNNSGSVLLTIDDSGNTRSYQDNRPQIAQTLALVESSRGYFFSARKSFIFSTDAVIGFGKDIPLDNAIVRKIGMNICSAADYERTNIFADVMKSSRDVRKLDGQTPASVDAKGNPLEPSTIILWAGRDKFNGSYKLKFTGQADITLGFGAANIQNKVYDVGTNTTTASLNYTDTSNSGLKIGFSAPVSDIRLMRPIAVGSSISHDFNELFSRPFLQQIQRFDTLRVMDLLATNSNQTVEWSERLTPDYLSYHVSDSTGRVKGVPWEILMELANTTGKNLWICVPHKANDNYITQLATLIKNLLNPNIKVYVEWSNEVWNTAPFFQQGNDNFAAADEIIATGNHPLVYDGETGYAVGFRRIIERGINVSKIFRGVFGDSRMMSQIRPVFAWQQGNYAITSEAMKWADNWYNNQDGNHVSDPNPLSYYFYGGGGSGYYNPDNNATFSTVAEVFNSHTMVVEQYRINQKTEATYCALYGLTRCVYEGGNSYDGSVIGDTRYQSLWVPEMRTSIVQHFEAYEDTGNDGVFCFFDLADGGEGENGWAFLKFIEDDVSTSPKMQALDDLNTGTRKAIARENKIPVTIPGAQWAVSHLSYQSPSSFAGQGYNTNSWYGYVFYSDTEAQRTLTVTYANANGSLRLILNGETQLEQNVSGNGTVTLNVNIPANKMQGIRLRCASGSFTVNSIVVS